MWKEIVSNEIKRMHGIRKACGLYSIEECYDNIILHRLSLFEHNDILKEIEELQKDILYNYPDLFSDMFQRRKRIV